MIKIKFDENLLNAMSFFEKITHVKLKDCIISETSYMFIVNEGYVGKAVGKNAVNVQKLTKSLNRKIKIVEFNPNLLQFVRNSIFPLKMEDVTETDGIVTISGGDTKTKGLLIGRNAQNLRQLEKIVQRYFKINEIKVV